MSCIHCGKPTPSRCRVCLDCRHKQVVANRNLSNSRRTYEQKHKSYLKSKKKKEEGGGE
jgi:hypothetical protein